MTQNSIDNLIAGENLGDSLRVAVVLCAKDQRFVSEFNRLTNSNFPQSGKADVKAFVDFVTEFVLKPVMFNWLTEKQDTP